MQIYKCFLDHCYAFALQSKELVEGVPSVLKQGVTKDEADQIVEKVKAAGGEVTVE